MKMLLVLACLFVVMQVKAGTVYVQTHDKFIRSDLAGAEVQRLLNTWEEKNPSQQIVATSVHHGEYGYICGVWITFRAKTSEELRASVPEHQTPGK